MVLDGEKKEIYKYISYQLTCRYANNQAAANERSHKICSGECLQMGSSISDFFGGGG